MFFVFCLNQADRMKRDADDAYLELLGGCSDFKPRKRRRKQSWSRLVKTSAELDESHGVASSAGRKEDTIKDTLFMTCVSRFVHAMQGNFRNFCVYEWFYSTIDEAFFLRDDSFHKILTSRFGPEHAEILTRHEWALVRRLCRVDRPRRFSSRFVDTQLKLLQEHRTIMRTMQRKFIRNEYVSLCFPYPLCAGARVTALHPIFKQLSTGVVLSSDFDNNRVLVQFDLRTHGIFYVFDYDVRAQTPFYINYTDENIGAEDCAEKKNEPGMPRRWGTINNFPWGFDRLKTVIEHGMVGHVRRLKMRFAKAAPVVVRNYLLNQKESILNELRFLNAVSEKTRARRLSAPDRARSHRDLSELYEWYLSLLGHVNKQLKGVSTASLLPDWGDPMKLGLLVQASEMVRAMDQGGSDQKASRALMNSCTALALSIGVAITSNETPEHSDSVDVLLQTIKKQLFSKRSRMMFDTIKAKATMLRGHAQE